MVVIGGEQTWVIKGVVRAVIPEIQVVVLTHDEIPGYYAAGMTMGFKVKDAKLLEGAHVGDVGASPSPACRRISRSPPSPPKGSRSVSSSHDRRTQARMIGESYTGCTGTCGRRGCSW